MQKIMNQTQDQKSKKQKFNIIGESPAWNRVLNDVIALSHAPSTVTVFLTGETGTGKEVIARAIHDSSDRSGRMFVPINCAAIPSDLLESVLFGHEKGAFTGAYAKNLGKFEQAEGGTILLDEIGEMSFPLQAKLLRVLQEKQVDRIGGRESVPVDVRIIAATHRDLQKKVIDGEFREDLYYRLNVYPIELPPLRERREDISNLTSYAIEKLMKRGYPSIHFNNDVLNVMENYTWPGNVRELMNLIERIAVQCIFNKKETVTIEDLPKCFFSDFQDGLTFDNVEVDAFKGILPENKTLPEYLLEMEKKIIWNTITEASGNISHAAKKLGIPRSTLISKMHTLSLPKWNGFSGDAL